jgi:methenyltetrahydromethanopterin cyclohydrolase
MENSALHAQAAGAPSVNALAGRIVEEMIARAGLLRVNARTGDLGETLIDAGASTVGGIDAGIRLASICMGGLGRISLTSSPATAPWIWTINVRAALPAIACLGSQYAGWTMRHGNYYVLGSGPGRAVGRVEELYEELGYRDDAGKAIFVLETASPPPAELVRTVAGDCRLKPSDLVFIYAPTQSLAGSFQVVARVLEVALHKARAIRFPLERIVDGAASAPFAPPAPDFVAAMGRTNDAIIYGGQAQLFVSGPESDARDLAEKLPSCASRDYGKTFADVFKSFDCDFYKIDPMLFSPAAVTVTALETGRSFHAGGINMDLLNASFS